MKNIPTTCFRAIVLGGALTLASVVHAQVTSTTTSTTSSVGTVSQLTPGVISVRTESSSSPVSYSYSKTTTYVDENGNPVSMETVRSGVPVTVYYTQDGDRMVASKVIVRKTVSAPAVPPVIEKKTTTTTTTPAE